MFHSIVFSYTDSENSFVIDDRPTDEFMSEADAYDLVKNYLEYYGIEHSELCIMAIMVDPEFGQQNPLLKGAVAC